MVWYNEHLLRAEEEQLKQNSGEGTHHTLRRGMNDFRKALLLTATPVVFLGVILAMEMTRESKTGELTGVGVFIKMVVLGMGVLATLACGGFAIARKRQMALGVLAGLGIGAAGIVLSSFALNTLQ